MEEKKGKAGFGVLVMVAPGQRTDFVARYWTKSVLLDVRNGPLRFSPLIPPMVHQPNARSHS